MKSIGRVWIGAVVAAGFLVGCPRATVTSDASVAVPDVVVVEDAPTPIVEAGTGTIDVAAPTRSCADLAPEEKTALETCASSHIHALGYHGAFTVRVAMSGSALPQTRTENDIEHKFRDAQPGDACDRAATLLASHLPCTWDVRGPFPAWTIKVVHNE